MVYSNIPVSTGKSDWLEILGGGGGGSGSGGGFDIIVLILKVVSS
jgi:hypothetical protein